MLHVQYLLYIVRGMTGKTFAGLDSPFTARCAPRHVGEKRSVEGLAPVMALPLMSLPASARGMQAACSADTQTMLEALGHKVGRSVTFVFITKGHRNTLDEAAWASGGGRRFGHCCAAVEGESYNSSLPMPSPLSG